MKKLQERIWRKKGKLELFTMDVDQFLQKVALQAMVHVSNKVQNLTLSSLIFLMAPKGQWFTKVGTRNPK